MNRPHPTQHHSSRITRFLAHVLNIAPHEAPRILFAWSLKFCVYVGYAIGWTMLTAMLVNRLGILYLPFLVIANAALTMLGTLVFAEIIHRVSRRVVLFATALSGVVLLGAAVGAILPGNSGLVPFFICALLANAVFFSQLNILIGLFAEDLFSPLEGERAWPLIATSKYIGGIVGGLTILFGVSVLHMDTPFLTVFWMASILLVVPLLAWFFARNKALPSLSVGTQKKHTVGLHKLREGVHHIRRTPFLTGLFLIILLHGMFYAMLNFQYTKAVDMKASKYSDPDAPQIAKEDTQLGQYLTADVLSLDATDAHDVPADTTAEAPYADEPLYAAADAAPGHTSGKNTHSHEDLLTKDLGALYVGFSALALFVQFFLTSRIIEKIGIVRTMLLHPLVSLCAALGMLFQFSFPVAAGAKASLTTTTGVFQSSYLASFYALREDMREHAKELMEGLVGPLGTLIGTGAVVAVQFFLAPSLLTVSLNIALVVVALAMAGMLLWMRTRYTHVSKKNMDIMGDHPAKFSSIEVLAQAGHANAAEILVKSLIYKKESEAMRIKILETLGRLRDPKTIPEILTCFTDKSSAVKLAAVRALGEFTDLGTHFYSQAFTRHRVISALKELFEHEDSKEIRSAIVHVFANMRQAEVVPFLIQAIETADDPVRADAIYVCGLFHDVSAAHYIEPCVQHSDPMVKANAIITLWQFPQYRLRLTIQLTGLLESDDELTKKASVYVLGEIGAIQEKPRLLRYLEHEDGELRLLAALALAKMDHEDTPDIIADFVLHEDKDVARLAKKYIRREARHIQDKVDHIVHHRLSRRLRDLLAEVESGDLTQLPDTVLAELREIYAEAGEWHEVVKIDAAAKKRAQMARI